jgi:small redox-active disulfide protein 2
MADSHLGQDLFVNKKAKRINEVMKIKVLGVGCASCRRMVEDVRRIVQKKNWQNVQVEYVQDLPEILSYGVMSTPALVVDEKVVMIGYRGLNKIEQVLEEAFALQLQNSRV